MTADWFKETNKRTYGLVRASNAGAAPLPYVIYNDYYSHKRLYHSPDQQQLYRRALDAGGTRFQIGGRMAQAHAIRLLLSYGHAQRLGQRHQTLDFFRK